MISDYLRCSTDIFDVLRILSIAHRCSIDILRCVQMFKDVFRCSKMFSDDHRCSWIFSRCSLDVLRMFAGFFQDVFRMLRWVMWVGLVEFDDHFK